MNEFCLIWFESSQKWLVLFACGVIIDHNFGSTGSALAHILAYLNKGDADFDCTEGTGDFYRYELVL